jgi:predicted nucleotidyltransferase
MNSNSPFDFQAAGRYLDQKIAAQAASHKLLFEQASLDAQAIITMISSQFKPQRVYVWGSLLNGNQFDENSDIDIAVEGLTSVDQFFDLYGKAMDMTSFPLDLVELEKIDPIHQDTIKTRGKIVYEQV